MDDGPPDASTSFSQWENSFAKSNATSMGAAPVTSFGIQVAVRVRPFNKRELEDPSEKGEDLAEPMSIVDVERDHKTITLLDPNKMYQPRATFTFDNVFSAFAPTVQFDDEQDDDDDLDERAQLEVYQALGAPILESAWQGYNNCIFCYGQTSSGKTYTMMGPKSDPGLIPRLCRNLFERIEDEMLKQEQQQRLQQEQQALQQQQEAEPVAAGPLSLNPQGTPPTTPPDQSGALPGPRQPPRPGPSDSSAFGFQKPVGRKIVKILVSYMEIYNEQVKDLLRPKPKGVKPKFNTRFDSTAVDDEYQNLRVRQHPLHGPFVEGLTKIEVSSWLDCVRVIRQGNEVRAHCATSVNDNSSRSHAIFQMVITQIEALGAKVRGKEVTNHKVSKINMVDLAGSERMSKTTVSGKHIDEANYINKSLLTLRKVIDVLVQRRKPGQTVVVPYRESLLTWILADNFGGNSKTSMIANVSPHYSCFQETESSLRYATLAKGIVNRVRVNEDPSAKLIRELQAQLKALQREMSCGPHQDRVRELEEQMEENKRAMEELLEREAGMRQLIRESRVREEQLRLEKECLEKDQEHWKREAERLEREKEELRKELEKLHLGEKPSREFLSQNRGNFWLTTEESMAAQPDLVASTDETACPPQRLVRRKSASGSTNPMIAGQSGASPQNDSPGPNPNDPKTSADASPLFLKQENTGGKPPEPAPASSAAPPPVSVSGTTTPPNITAAMSPKNQQSPSQPVLFGRRAATSDEAQPHHPPISSPASTTSATPGPARTATGSASGNPLGGRRRVAEIDPGTSSLTSVPLSLQHLVSPAVQQKVSSGPDALDSFLAGNTQQKNRRSAVPPWKQRREKPK